MGQIAPLPPPELLSKSPTFRVNTPINMKSKIEHGRQLSKGKKIKEKAYGYEG